MSEVRYHVMKAVYRLVLLKQSSRSHILIPVPMCLCHFTKLHRIVMLELSVFSLLFSCTQEVSAAWDMRVPGSCFVHGGPCVDKMTE